jgi:hypothetical protein
MQQPDTTEPMSTYLIEIFKELKRFYSLVPNDQHNPVLSLFARHHAYDLLTTLTPRPMDLYQEGQQHKKNQLTAAYEDLIITIHTKFHTIQQGSLSEEPTE